MKNMEQTLSNVSKHQNVMDVSLCPSCFMEKQAKDTQCAYCGIVFVHYYRSMNEKRTKFTVNGLRHLKATDIASLAQLWKNIEALYTDENSHAHFLRECVRLNSLPYAAYCYSERIKIHPEDDIARLQLNKVAAMALDFFGRDMDDELAIYKTNYFRAIRFVSWLAIPAGVLVIFGGLITLTPKFYMGFGLFIILSFMWVINALRRFKQC